MTSALTLLLDGPWCFYGLALPSLCLVVLVQYTELVQQHFLDTLLQGIFFYQEHMNFNIFQGKTFQIRALSHAFLRNANPNLDLLIPECECSDSSFV